MTYRKKNEKVSKKVTVRKTKKHIVIWTMLDIKRYTSPLPDRENRGFRPPLFWQKNKIK